VEKKEIDNNGKNENTMSNDTNKQITKKEAF